MKCPQCGKIIDHIMVNSFNSVKGILKDDTNQIDDWEDNSDCAADEYHCPECGEDITDSLVVL